jgi:hypothetical protein
MLSKNPAGSSPFSGIEQKPPEYTYTLNYLACENIGSPDEPVIRPVTRQPEQLQQLIAMINEKDIEKIKQFFIESPDFDINLRQESTYGQNPIEAACFGKEFF